MTVALRCDDFIIYGCLLWQHFNAKKLHEKNEIKPIEVYKYIMNYFKKLKSASEIGCSLLMDKLIEICDNEDHLLKKAFLTSISIFIIKVPSTNGQLIDFEICSGFLQRLCFLSKWEKEPEFNISLQLKSNKILKFFYEEIQKRVSIEDLFNLILLKSASSEQMIISAYIIYIFISSMGIS